jgi:hypothetical protein
MGLAVALALHAAIVIYGRVSAICIHRLAPALPSF